MKAVFFYMSNWSNLAKCRNIDVAMLLLCTRMHNINVATLTKYNMSKNWAQIVLSNDILFLGAFFSEL
jgi:hypothetical protein